MTVYHPKSWLPDMPKGARFFLSKDDVRAAYPGIRDSHIVSASYSGPVNETTCVLTKPVVKTAATITTIEEAKAIVSTPAVNPAPAEEPSSVPAEPAPAKPAKRAKKTSKQNAA